jgi:hypothetical protein
MTRRTFFTVVLTVTLTGSLPATVEAGAYTVYKFNLKRAYEGWVRTDTTGVSPHYYPSVYTSGANCLGSIQDRLAENKRYGTQFEAFIIVYTPSYPPSGRLYYDTRTMAWWGYYGSLTFGPHSSLGYY